MTALPRRVAAPSRLGPLDAGALAAIVALGCWLRIGGLTSHDPWFDDAWVLLTGRHGLGVLLHTSATAPGYDLGLTALWGLDHHSTWLTQLPELAMGLIGIVAVFALVRWFGCRRPLPHLAALVVAAGPVAVAYSTRLKPYAFDLLLACLLIYLAERWRRAPSTPGLAWIGAASLLSCLSESSLILLASVTAMIAVSAIGRPALRHHAAAAVVWFVTLSVVLWSVSLRSLPPSLTTFWRFQGALLSRGSQRAALFSLQQMGAGFVGGLLHTPGKDLFTTTTTHLQAGKVVTTLVIYPLSPGELVISGCCFVLLGILCAVPVFATLRARARPVDAGFVAALSVIGGIVAALLGLAPFGGGRTDEALYPAVLVLAALLAEAWSDRSVAALPRWLRWSAAGLACAGLVVATSINRPSYPSSDVRGVATGVFRQFEPGEVVVVDGDASYTWAADRITRSTISYASGDLWSEGFHAVSRDRRVVLGGRFLEPDVPIRSLVARAARVWFVGETVGALLGTGETSVPLNRPDSSALLGMLHSLGFTRVEAHVDGLHVYALLLGRAPG